MTTATITTIRPKAPLTEIQFCAWVAQALPGDRLEYHRGFLVLDTFPVFPSLGTTSATNCASWAPGRFGPRPRASSTSSRSALVRTCFPISRSRAPRRADPAEAVTQLAAVAA